MKGIRKALTVFYSIRNAGDGSAYLKYFLSMDAAEKDQENQTEGWAESCTGSIETFVGSNVYKEAVLNKENKE